MNNRVVILIVFIASFLALNVHLYGQVEGESESTTIMIRKPPTTQTTDQQVVDLSGKEGFEFRNHALIIGIDNYRDPGLIDLDNPVSDAINLYDILTSGYLFDPENVVLLKDPTRAEIIRELDLMSNKLTRKDNLLIFYAGHGTWDRVKETGFWLPADAEAGSSVNWIRNSTIQDFVDDINTQHTLLITDACFAGSIFKSRGGFEDASKAINKLYSLPSRKAMTSGTLEQVPDRSVFLEYLLERLKENQDKYMSAGDLFISFREAVLNNSPTIPQYGIIQNTGDEGGDFIFIRRVEQDFVVGEEDF